MDIEAFYPLGVFLLFFVLFGLFFIVIGRRKDASEDQEQMEYLSRYSEAKRAQKELPIMLRKQSD